MSRVVTKITDLESLRKAKQELEQHIQVKQVNIQKELNLFKENLQLTSEEEGFLNNNSVNKTLSKFIVSKFIKPKSKLVSKISIFLGSFLIEKYSGTLQQSIAKWLNKKDQTKLNG